MRTYILLCTRPRYERFSSLLVHVTLPVHMFLSPTTYWRLRSGEASNCNFCIYRLTRQGSNQHHLSFEASTLPHYHRGGHQKMKLESIVYTMGYYVLCYYLNYLNINKNILKYFESSCWLHIQEICLDPPLTICI